ncbi:MAG TPA: hypothetical protein VNL77_05775 [Roseiflexaceae bacterium]|nr:hypothetical protein [Roseiflexaceae bacterium]
MGEQLMLGRLAVFAGGWTLDAAERICTAVGPLAASALDGLHALLDKQMVQSLPGSDGEPRFTMLETIREYALERLTERGESVAAQRAHAAYFRDLAEHTEPLLHGPEQIAWLDRLDEEHANLRVALAWLLSVGDVSGALQLAVALAHFWYVRGHFGEGHAWLIRALQAVAQMPRDEPATPTARHASLSHRRAWLPRTSRWCAETSSPRAINSRQLSPIFAHVAPPWAATSTCAGSCTRRSFACSRPKAC